MLSKEKFLIKRTVNLAKNNQKKEKRERNKAYARKFRKKTDDKYKKRRRY